MTDSGRISRIGEHWMLSDDPGVLDHIRRARIQVMQMGNFGVEFYSLVDDEEIVRFSAGMPLLGMKENLDLAAEVISQVQEAGARVVGQLSTTMVFGDHESRAGLFGDAWSRMWSEDILGTPAPCESADEVCQRNEDGALFWRTIPGRPYRTYRGCMANPRWLEMLKPMVRKGIELGLDGFNATHHYESYCHCDHCREHARADLQDRLTEEEREALFGTTDMQQVANPFDAISSDAPDEKAARLKVAVAQGSALLRKESFDAVFSAYGRSLNPDLLLAQWNHKYDFSPSDERSLLPTGLWARGEDYIWYSQGPHKWGSSIAQGYLADMGLPSRFMYAAGGGRPFVVNKYDYKRWRVWAAEAMAHHGTALAYHAGPPRLEQEESSNLAPEDFYGPVIRYQRFMAAHEELLHPAEPWSQIALVYPKRAELQAEMDCLDALKRLGQLLEDGHWLFDIILDEQLLERAGDYDVLILAEVERISAAEAERLQAFVEGGGVLIYTGGTARRDAEGVEYETRLLPEGRVMPDKGSVGGVTEKGRGRMLYIPSGPWHPEKVMLAGLDAEMPIHPRIDVDEFGQQFLGKLVEVVAAKWLVTDAPWHVRVRAWRPDAVEALVVHWINYLQVEEVVVETPIPVGPIEVECRMPDGFQIDRVEWHYPEMKEAVALEHEVSGFGATFTIPRLIVYGMSIIYLRAS